MVTPITSYPASSSRAAATELSTPPLIATATRSFISCLLEPVIQKGLFRREKLCQFRQALFVPENNLSQFHSLFNPNVPQNQLGKTLDWTVKIRLFPVSRTLLDRCLPLCNLHPETPVMMPVGVGVVHL